MFFSSPKRHTIGSSPPARTFQRKKCVTLHHPRPRSGFNFRNKRIPTNVCVWRDSCCCSRRHAKRPCEAFCAPDRRTGDESTGPKRVWDRSNDAGGLLSIMPPVTRSGKPSASLIVCPRQVCDGSEQQKKKILIINNNTLKPSRFLVHQDLVIAHFAAVAPLPLFARLTRQPFCVCVCVCVCNSGCAGELARSECA